MGRLGGLFVTVHLCTRHSRLLVMIWLGFGGELGKALGPQDPLLPMITPPRMPWAAFCLDRIWGETLETTHTAVSTPGALLPNRGSSTVPLIQVSSTLLSLQRSRTPRLGHPSLACATVGPCETRGLSAESK